MQKLNAVLISTTITFAALAGWLWFQIKEQASEIQTFQQSVQQGTQKVQAIEKERVELQKESSNLQETLQSFKTKPTPSALSKDAKAPSKQVSQQKKIFGLLKGMMNNPEMKEMIQQQQRHLFETMYRPLFEELALTEEEKEKFFDIFLESTLKGLDAASQSENLAQISQTAKDISNQQNEELAKLLGEDRFLKYQEYTKTAHDRMMVDQFKGQLAQTKMPLQDSQSKELMKIALEESAKMDDAWGGFGGFGSRPAVNPANPVDLEDIFSGNKIDEMVEKRKEMYQRIVDQATFLTNDQQKSLASFYEKQLDSIEIAMKMGRKFLGAEKAAE